MSFVGNLLNGAKGAGYEAQPAANIVSPSGQKQADEQYGNANSGLNQQQAFVNATQAQGGLGNQATVFQHQQLLENQLRDQAMGGGPNPAQAALNQNTGANIAAQAALMAGQRGSGANSGMIARQIGQQGANIQQQAVGQGATMQAQQQLAAQQALMQQQNAMQGVAGQQIGQQASALSGYNQGAQNEQQNVLNAISQQNNANMGMQSNINNANAGLASVNAGNQGKLLGGLLGGAGSALMAHGGEVHNYADGGSVGPQSFFGKALSGMGGFNQNNQGGPNQAVAPTGFSGAFNAQDPVSAGAQQFGQGLGSMIGRAFKPGSGAGAGSGAAGLAETAGPAASAFAFNKGGMAESGGKVNGAAKVSGDSLKNDTVPTMLSPGEIVLPRSVAQHPNAPEEAAKFVAAVMAKRGLK